MYNYQQTVELLERAVAEKGEDYVYPVGEPGFSEGITACLYQTAEGEPLCIVGHVLSYIGLLDQVAEGKEAGELWPVENNFDYDARQLLVVAQWEQDASHSWGEALSEALRQVPQGLDESEW